MSRCAICNKLEGHAAYCPRSAPCSATYAQDERRPPTSAERWAKEELPGRADADIRPSGERYYPVGRPIPDEAFGRGPIMDSLPAAKTDNCPDCEAEPCQAHAKNCPTLLRFHATPAEAAHVHLGINPKDIIGSTKTPLGLLPWTALVQVAGVFKVGADKYGAYNWRTQGQPVQHVTYVEAAFRHLAAYMDGQTIDPETGCNHLAHAACGLLILLDASAVGNAIDNRPTPGVAAEIMKLP